ncbi:hypothetical protein ACIPSK_29085 [Rhizobium sp. LARHSG275]|uniref:hypothetical protein n=1 Tax=Rhizobium TaxID=379 RepID=UPI00138A3DE3|nr:hypothetical protein [Rhizobium laguerreae]NDK53160.1 hypothetical protein [Rhizobium laguerreae]
MDAWPGISSKTTGGIGPWPRLSRPKAKSYFARRIGKIHLAVLAIFIVTTLFLAIWNLYEAKIQRTSQIKVTSPLQSDLVAAAIFREM